MSEFARAHAALFDELERQGIFCADIVRLTRAVMDAQTIIAQSPNRPAVRPSPELYRRCESCE